MQTLINIIVFVLVLTGIVTIHEFGHFITAKMFGVYCGSFSIGMGPKIFSKKGKETEFQIRALPIGGFVTMAGETDQEENELFKDVPVERTLKGIKTYQKVIIFLAGVFMNFVLALVIILGLNLTVREISVDKVIIGEFTETSNAKKAGLEVGDEITAITNTSTNKTVKINEFNDLAKALTGTNAEETFKVTIKRNNETKDILVPTQLNTQSKRYYLGIVQATRKMTPVEAITNTFTTFGTMALLILDALKQLVLNFVGTVQQLSGPVGIYTVTAEVTSRGDIANILYLMAMLSVNIGVFNLMPIPGLDGAQTIVAIIEGILKREIPQRLKLTIQLVGLGCLLLLMFIVTYQDIIRLLK